MPGSKKFTAPPTSKKSIASHTSSTNAKSTQAPAKPAAKVKKGPAVPVDDSTTIKPPPPPCNKAPASNKVPAPHQKPVASSKENTAPAPSPPIVSDSSCPKACPKPRKDTHQTHQPADDLDTASVTAMISDQTPRLNASAVAPNVTANAHPTKPTMPNKALARRIQVALQRATPQHMPHKVFYSAPTTNKRATNANQNLGLIDVNALMAKVTAQQAEIEALRRQSGGNQSNHSDITLDENKSIPRPPIVKNIAQAMQMYDNVADKPTSEYHHLCQSVYLKLISLGVDPETQTYCSLGRTHVSSLANTIWRELPILNHYKEGWPVFDLMQSVIKNQRHHLSLTRRKEEASQLTKKGTKAGTVEDQDVDEGEKVNEEEEEEEEGKCNDEANDTMGQEDEGVEDGDNNDNDNQGGDILLPASHPSMPVDNHGGDDDDDNMYVETNEHSAYHTSQDDNGDIICNPPSPMQCDDEDANMDDNKPQEGGRKRRASVLEVLMETQAEKK